MAIEDKFGYVRDELRRACENSAQHITWVICRETGKHLGNDTRSVIYRERLMAALEDFLRG